MIEIQNSQGRLTVANDGGFPVIAIYGPKGKLKGYIDFPSEDADRIVKELTKNV